MRLATTCTPLLIALLPVLAQAQQPASASADKISIFTVPMPPNWPVVMAANVPDSIKLSPSPTFEWRFPSLPGQGCTSGGQQNVSPCRGRVVEQTFPQEGSHNITLTVTDSTLKQPVVLTVLVEIRPIQTFPVSARPEIRSIPLDVWQDKYVKAFYWLKTTGVYEHFSLIHRSTFSVGVVAGSGTQRSSAHSSPAFLPWHRVSMRIIERALQVAANDDQLGLPYWDWMKGWDGIEPYMGGDGDPADRNLLKTGPFALSSWALPEDYPEPIKALTRKLGSSASFKFQTQAELDKLMSIPNYDLPPFNDKPTPNSFRNAVEGWLAQQDSSYGFNHNGVHRWTGGTLANVVYSFHDPLFLLHHAQVDRLFTMWQNKHSCADGRGSVTCYRPGETDPDVNANLPGAQQNTGPNGKSRYALVGHMFSDTMFPWRVRIRDALPVSQGYRYLEPNEAPPARNSSAPIAPGISGQKTDVSKTPKPKGLTDVPGAGHRSVSNGWSLVPLAMLSAMVFLA